MSFLFFLWVKEKIFDWFRVTKEKKGKTKSNELVLWGSNLGTRFCRAVEHYFATAALTHELLKSKQQQRTNTTTTTTTHNIIMDATKLNPNMFSPWKAYPPPQPQTVYDEIVTRALDGKVRSLTPRGLADLLWGCAVTSRGTSKLFEGKRKESDIVTLIVILVPFSKIFIYIYIQSILHFLYILLFFHGLFFFLSFFFFFFSSLVSPI